MFIKLLDTEEDVNAFAERWKFSNIGDLNPENAQTWMNYEMRIKNEQLELNGVESDFEGEILKE